MDNIAKIEKILDKIVLMNYARRNSGELLDIISYIYVCIEKQDNVEFEETPGEYKFKFWNYYDELEDYYSSEVVITKDLKNLTIDMTYGSIHFYESFNIGTTITKNDILDEENYYSMSFSK